MTGKRRTRPAPPADEPPRVRKAYVECRFGQLHVTTAFPVGGGFDERATLVCVHRGLASSRVFRPFIGEIGRDRSVYAPDLPGCGESDPTPPRPTIEQYAGALADFLDQMRFRQVDVLGQHAGALIAAELAIARPGVVRRVMLVGVPALSQEERTTFARAAAPLACAADGSHLLAAWQRAVQAQDPGLGLADAASDFAIQLHNGPDAWWLPAAALNYAASERLPLVAQPVLLVRTRDALWEASLRARPWFRNLKVLELPGHGCGVFRSAPAELAAHVRTFLDS
jgi:pimeloyl-ACP methyl ester carboxylesterase